MATRLKEVAVAVHELLNAALPEAEQVKDYHDQVALTQHQQRRRIVWLTQGGTTEPPKQGGGRLPSDASAYRIQACKTRVERVDAHLFAETRELTEQLLDQVIAALCTVLQVVEIPGYEWRTEEVGEAGRALRVACCVLRFLLRLPVPEEIKPLTPITGVEDVCGTLQPDGSIKPQEV